MIHFCASGSSSTPWTPFRSLSATNPALLRRPKRVLTKEHTKHEAKLPNNKRGLEAVSCSERFMESSPLNAAKVEMELVHGPLQTEITHSETS